MGVSSDHEHLVAHEVKPDAIGLREIEVVGSDRFLDVRPQIGPSVALGENALGQTLGAVPTVGLLRDLEDDFVHALQSRPSELIEQAKPGNALIQAMRRMMATAPM